MHLGEERQDPAKHAEAVCCPWCRKAAAILLFDSRAVGMVCTSCHRRFMDLRKEAALVPRHLRAHVVITTRPARCAQCHELACVLVESYGAGLLCRQCHGGIMPVSEESSDGVPPAPASRSARIRPSSKGEPSARDHNR